MQYKEIIQKGQKKITNYVGVPREAWKLAPLRNLKKIITILGGRKVGKTYTLLQLMQEALQTNLCKLEEMIFIDFSELSYRTINIDDLHQYVLSQGIEHPVYCFDEIQEVVHFERQLISLYNQGCKLFITGSNSKMLSAELATILRGKTYELHQTPLSFSEFLLFKGHKNLPNDLVLDQLFDEFVNWGGYPEVVLTDEEEVKKGILQGYLEILIFKDLVDRYKIRNQYVLQSLIKSLILGSTKELNVSNLFNTYKSQGMEVSKNTLYEYVAYIQHTFFVSAFDQFYKKAQFEKMYLIDTGFLNCYSSKSNWGQKFETVFYHHFQKKLTHFGFVKEPFEIDFTDGDTNRQICRELDEENRNRESKFSEAKQKNMLITRYAHTFSKSGIEMQYWKEVLL